MISPDEMFFERFLIEANTVRLKRQLACKTMMRLFIS